VIVTAAMGGVSLMRLRRRAIAGMGVNVLMMRGGVMIHLVIVLLHSYARFSFSDVRRGGVSGGLTAKLVSAIHRTKEIRPLAIVFLRHDIRERYVAAANRIGHGHCLDRQCVGH